MAFINNLDQLSENIQVLDSALLNGSEDAIDLVGKGRCFVVSDRDGKLSFGPSRFLGYKSNTITKHLKKRNVRDGRETNPLITKVTGVKKEANSSAEKAYLHHCASLGIEPTKNKRTYWVLPEAEEFLQLGIIEDINHDPVLTETEKSALIKSRVGQGKFRSSLEKKWKKCCVTGITVNKALRASHIKPWSKCNNTERLDPNNGLLLIANADAIFDSGLISFDENGNLIRSPQLSKEEMISLLGKDCFHLRLNKSQLEYMEFHREKVFKRGKA